MSDEPRVLACEKAPPDDIRMVKRDEPCPWCGKPWNEHPESGALEWMFRRTLDEGQD